MCGWRGMMYNVVVRIHGFQGLCLIVANIIIGQVAYK